MTEKADVRADELQPGPKPYDVQSDAQSAGIRDLAKMFERDRRRAQVRAEHRQRVLAAFPDAPSELGALMAQEPWLAEWLTRLAGNQAK